MIQKSQVLGLVLMLTGGCVKTDTSSVNIIQIDPKSTISTAFVGNGVQWGGYRTDYGHGKIAISDADWDKLYRRLDYMKPGFMRLMVNTASQFEDGRFCPEKNTQYLIRMLDYCQSRGVTVMFGDWGGGLVSGDTKQVDEDLIDAAVRFVEYLVAERGYSCIKYYNFINEPNGWWSTPKGDYDLWAEGLACFNRKLQRSSIAGRVGLVGPDIAIWTADECHWVEQTAVQFGDVVGLYDIHTYPSKYTINSGEYYDIVRAYRDAAPAGSRIVMGEIGLKYVHPADSALSAYNVARAEQHPYASVADSQMSVFDFSYGVDMADALVQVVQAGYSGSIAWMLDDAMYSNEAPDKLKIWGFWNILGEEFFGQADEQVRPWYYSWSLLCRYMPAGSNVLSVNAGDSPLRTCVLESSGSYSIVAVNSNAEATASACLKSSEPLRLENARIYLYEETSNKTTIADEQIQPVKTGETINLGEGYRLTMPPSSVMVITNIEP